YIESKHYEGLYNSVKETLDHYKKNTTDLNLFSLLDYIDSNLKTILCGNRDALCKIINRIERSHYIPKHKLQKILKKRRRFVSTNFVSTKELQSYLISYAIETNLINHLHPKDLLQIGTFEKSVKDLYKIKWKNYSEILEKIFDYKVFTMNSKGWSAYDLVSQLGISVCPYCNRSFISILKTNNKKTRPVLDHYYAKSLYPYLSLSLFNLIPSCYVCNSSFKKDDDFYTEEAIYPYEEEFSSSVTFKTDFLENKPYDYKYLLGISNNFSIKISNNALDDITRKKIDTSIKTFALDEIYNNHQDYVKDVIRSSVINTTERIKEIHSTLPDLFKSENDVLQTLYLSYFNEQDVGKRPLSKLTKDVYDQITLLK
ncbi:hypothetical protein, partial [Rossellomorea marisflavi]|uniref:hypothetical protein n=1 Tax=Rossellomorea marisflavi TaxID=189381 RepID=UPI00064EDBDC